ncbi:MAG: BON domain-containing protein [Vicinamibacterales bacterium]
MAPRLLRQPVVSLPAVVMMRNWVICAIALPALLCALPAAAAQVADSDLAERVTDTVHHYPKFSIFDDVNVAVNNRVVTLTGRVTTSQKREELGERAGRIDGVKSVSNDIGVLPPSAVDQRLRAQVASAIYNHPAFWRYAELLNPPIHIVIENQRIVLTGDVESPVDRTLAYSLAQVDGAISVTNQLRVGRR